MKVGILVPLAFELETLTGSKIKLGHCANLTDTILVCHSGVGAKSAKRAVRKLIDSGVDFLISWGTAAGLDPDIRGGALIVPSYVKVSGKELETNPTIYDQLRLKLPDMKLVNGSLAACQGLLKTPEEKRQLFRATGCVAADMESGALAEMSVQEKIPFAVIRSVSDPENLGIPNSLLKSINNEKFHLSQFLLIALVRPWEWREIIKLGANFRKAKQSLSTVGETLKTVF